MGKVADWSAWRQRLNLKQDLAQSGWNLEGHESDVAAEPSVHIYYHEPMTNRFSIMGKLPVKSLMELVRRVKKRQLPKVSDMTGIVLSNANIAAQMHSNELVSKRKRQSAYDDLLLSLAAYLVQTKVFEQLRSQGLDNASLFVNGYVWPGEDECFLRPFAMVGGGMFRASEALDQSRNVMIADQRKHPEWFPDNVPLRAD